MPGCQTRMASGGRRTASLLSQHVHGTDNARCLIAMALVTGQIGRPGTGLHQGLSPLHLALTYH